MLPHPMPLLRRPLAIPTGCSNWTGGARHAEAPASRSGHTFAEFRLIIAPPDFCRGDGGGEPDESAPGASRLVSEIGMPSSRAC